MLKTVNLHFPNLVSLMDMPKMINLHQVQHVFNGNAKNGKPTLVVVRLFRNCRQMVSLMVMPKMINLH